MRYLGQPTIEKTKVTRSPMLIDRLRCGDQLQSTDKDVAVDKITRRICLFLSNTILQFPLIFELQQKSLNQPQLLRQEIEAELKAVSDKNTSFRVLDYGCGSGTYTGLFPAQNYLGIDSNQSMLKRASQLHPDHSFIQATNLSGISTYVGDVTQVFMIGVIHHLSETDLLFILHGLSKTRPIKLLAIDTLQCTKGPGRFIQFFERGEFLRSEKEHLRLLSRVADQISYKKVPYGRFFELAVFRGIIKQDII